MNNELTIQTGAQTNTVFLQNGFYYNIAAEKRLHYHHYTEIHLFVDGGAVFVSGEQKLTIQSCTVLVIPPNTFHGCWEAEESTRHRAFQIDRPVNQLIIEHMDPTLIRELVREIDRMVLSGDHSAVSAYLSLICLRLGKVPPISVKPIDDSGFLIREFFQNHYSEDIHLCDLAQALHLSERQTERLVIAHTGKTFRGELTATRVTIAKRLLSTGLSKSEVARLAGFRSLAGFWKALKKEEAATTP